MGMKSDVNLDRVSVRNPSPLQGLHYVNITSILAGGLCVAGRTGPRQRQPALSVDCTSAKSALARAWMVTPLVELGKDRPTRCGLKSSNEQRLFQHAQLA
jgi:hypothetical protein